MREIISITFFEDNGNINMEVLEGNSEIDYKKHEPDLAILAKHLSIMQMKNSNRNLLYIIASLFVRDLSFKNDANRNSIIREAIMEGYTLRKVDERKDFSTNKLVEEIERIINKIVSKYFN